MHRMTEQDAADFLDAAQIEETHDAGHTVIHIGRSPSGCRFVLVNDCLGRTVLSEAL
jgi:hypothetical protein